jgi:hypothetical protein
MSRIRVFTISLAGLVAVAWAVLAQAAEDHRQYADAKPQDCAECHRSSGVVPNHGAFFLRDHRLLALKATNNCKDCHQQSFCSDCHRGGNLDHQLERGQSRRGENMPGTHAPHFVSTHPIRAASDPQSCARCHDSRRFCSDCHQRSGVDQGANGLAVKPHAPTFSAPGVPDPSWVSFHRGEARRNLESCQACHPRKADCSNFACHPGLGGR